MFVSLFFIVLSAISIVFSTLAQFNSPPFSKSFDVIEVVCIIWFTFEVLFRFLLSSKKLIFFKTPLNVIDIISILPYYGSTIFSINYFHFTRKSIMLFKTLRIFSVLKLARHSVGLRSLGHTFRKCYKELGLLLVLFFIAVLLFSALIYHAEHEEVDTKFTSIPAAMWWALISLTT